MGDKVAGKAAKLAMEKDGDAAGTFTDITNLLESLDFEMTRETAEVTPHGDTIDSHLSSPAMTRPPISFSGAFDHDHATLDATTGLQKRFLDGDTFGILYKGPNWASGVDEVIISGTLTRFRRAAPNSADPYTFEAEFQPSGAMKIDNTSYGTVN